MRKTKRGLELEIIDFLKIVLKHTKYNDLINFRKAMIKQFTNEVMGNLLLEYINGFTMSCLKDSKKKVKT